MLTIDGIAYGEVMAIIRFDGDPCAWVADAPSADTAGMKKAVSQTFRLRQWLWGAR